MSARVNIKWKVNLLMFPLKSLSRGNDTVASSVKNNIQQNFLSLHFLINVSLLNMHRLYLVYYM
jgi:hypothetical protein